ncbi:MAG: hypothetical protein AABX08_00685, partial [Nanoarchaeota archaeon]
NYSCVVSTNAQGGNTTKCNRNGWGCSSVIIGNTVGNACYDGACIATATTTSSLDPRSRNTAIISKMINSLNEILKQFLQILK